MANTLRITKETSNEFWHVHNNDNATKFAISDFEVSLDGNIFKIVEIDGSKRFNYLVQNISLIDNTGTGALETFTNAFDLYKRLIQIKYTPFAGDKYGSGNGGNDTAKEDKINKVSSIVGNESSEILYPNASAIYDWWRWIISQVQIIPAKWNFENGLRSFKELSGYTYASEFNETGFSTLAEDLAGATIGVQIGANVLRWSVNNRATTLTPGIITQNNDIRLPNKSGTVAFISDISDFIVQNVSQGDTTHAPSGNAVFEVVLTIQNQIDGINLLLTSDNIDLDTIQEIVDAIEDFQYHLDTILVNDLVTGGVTKALTAEMGKVLQDTKLTATIATDAEMRIIASVPEDNKVATRSTIFNWWQWIISEVQTVNQVWNFENGLKTERVVGQNIHIAGMDSTRILVHAETSGISMSTTIRPNEIIWLVNNYTTRLTPGTVTQNNNISLPDKSGVLALASDVVDISNVQNNLNHDGTGKKIPTVDAVNNGLFHFGGFKDTYEFRSDIVSFQDPGVGNFAFQTGSTFDNTYVLLNFTNLLGDNKKGYLSNLKNGAIFTITNIEDGTIVKKGVLFNKNISETWAQFRIALFIDKGTFENGDNFAFTFEGRYYTDIVVPQEMSTAIFTLRGGNAYSINGQHGSNNIKFTTFPTDAFITDIGFPTPVITVPKFNLGLVEGMTLTISNFSNQKLLLKHDSATGYKSMFFPNGKDFYLLPATTIQFLFVNDKYNFMGTMNVPVELSAGTETTPSLIIPRGVLTTVPQDGAIERGPDGMLYETIGGVRYRVGSSQRIDITGQNLDEFIFEGTFYGYDLLNAPTSDTYFIDVNSAPLAVGYRHAIQIAKTSSNLPSGAGAIDPIKTYTRAKSHNSGNWSAWTLQ